MLVMTLVVTSFSADAATGRDSLSKEQQEFLRTLMRDTYCFTFDDVIESMTLLLERESWFYHQALFRSTEFSLRLKAIRIITKEPSTQR